jgi:hypothetical protein
MHATNTFPVDRHPQYRHHLTTIRSIASDIIIEVKKNHITRYDHCIRVCGCYYLVSSLVF